MSGPDFNNLSIHEIMESINKRWFSKTALQIKTKDGWNALSYVPLGERAVDVSSTLLKLGIQKGDRAAILSESRPEWGIALFGIISCGGIVVPIDVKLSEKEIGFILNDSGAKFIFVSEKHLPAIDNIKPKLTALRHVFLLDDSARNDVIKIKDLKMKEGDGKYLPLEAEDTAVIVYTSGTTGVAKGVELTYKNLMFQAKELNRLVNYTEGDNFLSMLPMNHMLEMTGGLLSPLYVGATITYCDSLKPANIIALMNETRTTVMITVPLILKIFHDGIMKKAQSLPFLQKHFFFVCLHLCRFMLKLDMKPGKAIFGRIHGQFGRHLRCFVSGGAPLDQAVEMDFNAMGFTILQGYGLTETSPVIAVNTFKELKYGSVGKPIPGVEVKLMKPDGTLGEEGEIVTRGDHVMKGYYKNAEKTAEIIKDGWLHTGDIGKFDKDGFLYITGRIRNLIVLGGGKKVFPEEIEEVMSASPYIKEICVLGKKATEGLKAGTEEVFAVIVPNLERFEGAEKKDKELIRKKVEAEVGRLSNDLAEYKKISGLMLYFDELPKTSTRKVKRKDVQKLIETAGTQEKAAKSGEMGQAMPDEASRRIVSIIAKKAGVDPKKISADSDLYADLGIDSLQKVELICEIEREINVSLPEEEWQKATTLKSLVLLTEERGRAEKTEKFDPRAEAHAIIARSRLMFACHLVSAAALKAFFGVYVRLSVRGKDNLPGKGSFILAANHSSHLDYPLLYSIFPIMMARDVFAPAASDYFYKSKPRRFIAESLLNIFPFERSGNFLKGLKICEELMKQGKSIMLFPEGTRSTQENIGEFKPGIGMLSIELGLPIIPVYIRGAHDALGKGSYFIKPGKIELMIGKPIDPKGIEKGYNGYRELARLTKKEIEKISAS